MLKYKSIIFLLVCSFTISTSLWADTGFADAVDDTSISKDMGSTDVATDVDEGPETSTPLDPDYQPEVTSSPECTCRSVQTKSNFTWLPLLFIGGILGFSRKKWRSQK